MSFFSSFYENRNTNINFGSTQESTSFRRFVKGILIISYFSTPFDGRSALILLKIRFLHRKNHKYHDEKSHIQLKYVSFVSEKRHYIYPNTLMLWCMIYSNNQRWIRRIDQNFPPSDYHLYALAKPSVYRIREVAILSKLFFSL